VTYKAGDVPHSIRLANLGKNPHPLSPLLQNRKDRDFGEGDAFDSKKMDISQTIMLQKAPFSGFAHFAKLEKGRG
jgi:hypothetical protein